MGNVRNIAHFPLSLGVRPESIGTNGFCEAKRPAKRLPKLSAIETWQLQLCKIGMASQKDDRVRKK